MTKITPQSITDLDLNFVCATFSKGRVVRGVLTLGKNGDLDGYISSYGGLRTYFQLEASADSWFKIFDIEKVKRDVALRP